ncbi:hypothetical protein [Methylovulum psychrotolerans]|uniref:Uncharacterized protein n=1 Tax=Methylovulum psychrotolerans TaxID=1704499 RepID=A0A2S5CH49_9GAMM|nr:hypothetical protein [Methylovulum psychrotolerans]POZ50126.1 hypothetical protein AADEFJLK_04145 [Methylovulum psychrotolerans]
MKPYAQLPTDNPEEYKHLVGLSKEDFQHLNSKLCVYIGEQKALSPLTRRGRKDSKLTTEDRLLPPPLSDPYKLGGGFWYQRVILP